jgi:hypothetical protein
MNTYTYTDKSKFPVAAQVFECKASSIVEADGEYKKITGKDPVSQPYIHCSIEFEKAAE